jgi:transketolase
MYKHLRYDPKDPWSPLADRLVLSEGHSVPVVYAAYADLGGVMGVSSELSEPLKTDALDTLRELDSRLDGHPNPAEGFPFFDAATGSLGQGLSVGAGLALAARLDGSPRRVYVVIGDGESREGQIWEACDFIVDHGLKNVCAIFNCNGQGQADYVSPQQSPESLHKKLRAFGWNAKIVDGHSAEELLAALATVGRGRKPVAIVAVTKKGWGVADLQAHSNHGKPLPDGKLDKALAELDQLRARDSEGNGEMIPKTPRVKRRRARGPASVLPHPDFDALLEGDAKWSAGRKLATRRAYGLALRDLGRVNSEVVVLDADVSNSTFSEVFRDEFEDRFFECKIGEQNMISAAVGLSAAGKTPFVNSFAKFLVRGYDQVEMGVISQANIKLVGSHSGVTLAADGPSQMGLPDVAFFRSLSTVLRADRSGPAAVVFHPSDAVCAYKCTEIMMNHQGLCYMRTHRPDVPLIYDAQAEFRVGGNHLLREGDRLLLVASGYIVHTALQAAEQLAVRGIEAGVLDAYSLPLDSESMLAHADRCGGKIITIEDNYGGGLGSAMSELAAAKGGLLLQAMTVRRVPKSGRTPEDLLKYVGLDVDQIVDAASTMAQK